MLRSRSAWAACWATSGRLPREQRLGGPAAGEGVESVPAPGRRPAKRSLSAARRSARSAAFRQPRATLRSGRVARTRSAEASSVEGERDTAAHRIARECEALGGGSAT